MTDYHITFNFSNGRSIDVLAAGGSTVGKNLPCEKVGEANSGSPDSFTVDGNIKWVLTDVFFGCKTGAVELIRDGNNTGVVFRAGQCQADQAGRQKFALQFSPGVTYRIKVVSAIPA